MSKNNGVIDPSNKDSAEMFIGWDSAPRVDRRFLLGALPLTLAGIGGASYGITSAQEDPGPGRWLTNQNASIEGVLVTDPYPMIRVADPSAIGGIRTVFLVAIGKCTSALKLDPHLAKPVRVSGVSVERNERQLLEVPLLAQDFLEDASFTRHPRN